MEREVKDYLNGFNVTHTDALLIGQFLQRWQRPLAVWIHIYDEEAPILTYTNFVQWWHDAIPKFKVGDKVVVIRESHKSTCIIEAIIHQLTKPIGCYCDIRNIDKGTIQRVNQNKLQRV